MIQDLLTLSGTNSSGRQSEISLSREILLRQLLPEVRTQILNPYTMPLEDLIRMAQWLTNSARAAKRASTPAHPISSLQLEDGAEEEISAVTRRQPAYHHKKNPPGPCYYHQLYTWNFIVVDVRTPLLGADFLAHFGMAVDIGRKHLLNTDSCQSLPLAPRPSVPTIYSVATHQYAQLLKEFPQVFNPELHQVPGAPAKHRIYHHIKTKVPPVHAKFQRLPPQRLQEAKDAFPEMERMGINRKASSPSPKERLRHIQVVLQPLQENGLVVRFDKCTFGVEKADFLGHEISPDGIRPLASKVAAVTRFPTPTSVKAVQEFLGMVNYYRRLIPGITHTMGPHTEILKGQPKSLVWGPSQQQAFSLMKAGLAEATALAHQDPKAPLQLMTDASNVACGAVLEQIVAGAPQPIALFSKKLNLTEARYSTFDRELCAVYRAVRHFKLLLEGTPFTIWTDHQPLVHAFTKQGDAWSSRQQQHLAAIASSPAQSSASPA
ncbi:uncharacterized protein [Macrobrachium rosenbergii]|uniref:uncharacterized protein n=1 Tax=Macrobrachium rosenbergii TaxID=79674 RepID=UPI0034D6B456